MAEEARVLGLFDMLRRREGTTAQRLVRAFVSVALRLFFRRIETSRAELVPADGPVIFVLNHPNGLIDPALVYAALPRRISFLAKSTLFDLPVIGALLRAVEALPLYRRSDAGADLSQNRLTFEACRRLLRRGRAIALFPEGVSHNSTKLLPVKTGAARIALGAASIAEPGPDEDAGVTPQPAPPAETRLGLRIVPVGLYYTSKTSFRSEALLRFGEPLEVFPARLDEDGEPRRADVQELSARIEEALRGVTLNVESEEQLEVARRAERLFSSVYEGLNIRLPLAARFDFLRRFAAERLGRLAGAGAGLELRLLRHEEELRRIGLAPENLSLSRHSAWYVFRHFLLRGALLLLLAPLAIAGAALHYPAYLCCALLARLFPRHGPDEIAPTVKILAAVALMPLTWLVVAGLAFYFWGWRAAFVALPAAVVCGYAAMRTLEALADLRGWFKAVVLLVRRRRLFLRLLIERQALGEEVARAGRRTGV